jgi:hypothetical protein
MPIYKDVVVDITRNTQPAGANDYGMTLMLYTSATRAYQEYTKFSDLAADFQSTTDVYKSGQAFFSQTPTPKKLAVVGVSFTNDFNDVIGALNLLYALHSNFVYLVSDVTAIDNINLLAQWAAANKVIYVASLTFASAPAADILSSDYVAVMVNDTKGEYAESALVGRCSTYSPGSATWMFKSLAGVTPQQYDNQQAAVELINGKHFNTYVQKYGLPMTTGGFVTSGEYLDVMLGILYIQTEMEIALQQLKTSVGKVPYDNSGIALIASIVEGVLKSASELHILRVEDGLGQFSVSIPDVANIAVSDIAARELNDIRWDAYLAGAIHHTHIYGVVHY